MLSYWIFSQFDQSSNIYRGYLFYILSSIYKAISVFYYRITVIKTKNVLTGQPRIPFEKHSKIFV